MEASRCGTGSDVGAEAMRWRLVPSAVVDLPRAILPFVSPQQLFRALDDLHAIADAARSLPDVEARLTERVDALESRAAEILALGERIDGQATQLVETVEQAEGRVGELLDHADRLDGRIDELLSQFTLVDRRVGEVVERFDKVDAQVDDLVTEGKVIAVRAGDVADQGGRLADALPTLEQALKVVDELAPTAQLLAQT